MQSMKRGVLALAATLATAVTSGVALAAPAGPLPYPRCQPVCKGGPTHGPRVEAIFVHAHNGSQPLLVVDAYLAGFRHSPYGELCYEHTQPPAWVPGCVVHASARGRLTRKHTWHVHITTPIYTRGQLNGTSSDVLLRRYWVAVAAGATPDNSPAQGARTGKLQPLAGHPSMP